MTAKEPKTDFTEREYVVYLETERHMYACTLVRYGNIEMDILAEKLRNPFPVVENLIEERHRLLSIRQ